MWDMSHMSHMSIFIPTVTAYVLFYVLFSCILYDHRTKVSFQKFNKVSCILYPVIPFYILFTFTSGTEYIWWLIFLETLACLYLIRRVLQKKH